MSKELLYNLNGKNNGMFKNYLDNLIHEPRIAWYPSAGEDFRALLYLHPDLNKILPATNHEPAPPEIFLFTDYFPWSSSNFLDSTIIFEDKRTKISVAGVEELLKLKLPLDSEIVDFPKGSKATGRVLFLNIKVQSDKLGEFAYPLVYAFVENESFCAKKIIPLKGKIFHIIHVRYGGGCGGGGHATGYWLSNVLIQLGCEIFITDGHNDKQSGDEAAMRLYPELSDSKQNPVMEVIRTVKSEGWSGHGDVTWNMISR